jgi:single-stranded-DNA-specific exonuclease
MLQPRLFDAQSAQRLTAAGLPPPLARALAARGVQSSAELDLPIRELIVPGQLTQVQAAAQLLADAIAAGQRLLIVADYDCDGATACAVGLRGLRRMGAQVDYLVPNRFEYGYGLTPEIVRVAAEREPRPTLLITVDNGISSADGVAEAAALGMDVLVTDHHLPGELIPRACAILNPNQPGCAFPSKCLAGVGVVFYLLCGLRAELRQRDWFVSRGFAEPRLAELLDLVALGTVADVVPLDANNRILVHQGLLQLRKGRGRPGVRALLQAAGRQSARVTSADLGFYAGPRLNAAGRLQDMSLGIRCLMEEDPLKAREMAWELDALNRQRRSIEDDMQRGAGPAGCGNCR